jgi:hypothetical protein
LQKCQTEESQKENEKENENFSSDDGILNGEETDVDCDSCDVAVCDDGDLCTVDSIICDATTDSGWECVFTPLSCDPGFSCDPTDGLCKADDELIPCVAVIDEDDSFGSGSGTNQEQMWSEFKSSYPDRPFCLLVPGPEGDVKTPENFLSDDLTDVFFNVARDYGEVSMAEDWVAKCGLDLYTSANVGWVGLFIDDSGSLEESEVAASRDLFYSKLEAQGIQTRKVVNGDENWILPFLTTLAPTPDCVTSAGQSGQCLNVVDCADAGNISVPWQDGDPEPNCRELSVDIQCCVT